MTITSGPYTTIAGVKRGLKRVSELGLVADVCIQPNEPGDKLDVIFEGEGVDTVFARGIEVYSLETRWVLAYIDNISYKVKPSPEGSNPSAYFLLIQE